jgi:hypothetical protein
MTFNPAGTVGVRIAAVIFAGWRCVELDHETNGPTILCRSEY